MLEGFMAFFASLGFGILFNVPKRQLIYVAIVGMFGGLSYKLLLLLGIGDIIALFIASSIISLLSEILARLLHCPTTVFLICALVPLVPGGGMYYTILEIVNYNLNEALVMGINTLAQACSIVMGCTLISSIFYTINYGKNKTL